ncbi:hypothetical protein [Thiomicrospira pelophila]|uniref:hypothetical protein n=1 Tax=Thiomicrospira pelophila TaxID=934 RepID=UPI0004A74B67|nr:hypothetical protein [Thiomicrospira pelophila]
MSAEVELQAFDSWDDVLHLTSQSAPEHILRKDVGGTSYAKLGLPNFDTSHLKQIISGNSINAPSAGFSVSFSDCSFSEVRLDLLKADIIFKGCHFSSDVTIETSASRKITFKNCIFLGKVLLFSKPNSDGVLSLEDCQFKSSAEFVGFRFQPQMRPGGNLTEMKSFFINIDFDNSLTLSGCSFSKDFRLQNIAWPNFDSLMAPRDTFRQLKICMDESKNLIDEAFFHSLEMEAYRKELKKIGWRRNNWQDQFVFLFSRYTSNFAQSWFLPLVWMSLISILSYSYICGLTALWDCGLNSFFHFMNPFNRSSEHYMSAYTVWFLHKVIMIYLGYHFIVALRRKTKF